MLSFEGYAHCTTYNATFTIGTQITPISCTLGTYQPFSCMPVQLFPSLPSGLSYSISGRSLVISGTPTEAMYRKLFSFSNYYYEEIIVIEGRNDFLLELLGYAIKILFLVI